MKRYLLTPEKRQALACLVRVARQEQDLSQRDLARGAGVGITTLQNLEEGLFSPRPSSIQQIGLALGIDVSAYLPVPAGYGDRSGGGFDDQAVME